MPHDVVAVEADHDPLAQLALGYMDQLRRTHTGMDLPGAIANAILQGITMALARPHLAEQLAARYVPSEAQRDKWIRDQGSRFDRALPLSISRPDPQAHREFFPRL